MKLSEPGYLINGDHLRDWFVAIRKKSLYGVVGGLLMGAAMTRIIVVLLIGGILWPWLIVSGLAVACFWKQWVWRRYAKVRMWQMKQLPVTITHNLTPSGWTSSINL